MARTATKDRERLEVLSFLRIVFSDRSLRREYLNEMFAVEVRYANSDAFKMLLNDIDVPLERHVNSPTLRTELKCMQRGLTNRLEIVTAALQRIEAARPAAPAGVPTGSAEQRAEGV